MEINKDYKIAKGNHIFVLSVLKKNSIELEAKLKNVKTNQVWTYNETFNNLKNSFEFL